MRFDAHDVVVVPFPFTDRAAERRRPALIVSQARALGDTIDHSVLAMITTARHSDWPNDVDIVDLEAAGLETPCVVRMKLFTLDHRLIIRRAGALASADGAKVNNALCALFGFGTAGVIA